jgi:hypothetical protein
MAQYAFTFTSGDTVTPTKLNDARTVSEIVDADIKSDAAIAGTKLLPDFGNQEVSAATFVSRPTGNEGGQFTMLNVAGNATGSFVDVDASNNLRIFNAQNTSTSIFTNNAERMRITADGGVLIGVSPTTGSLLSVNQGITARVDGAGLTPFLQLFNSNAAADLKTWRIGGYDDGKFTIETVNDAYSAAAERLRIDASGNVGIGTAPSYTLHVNGSVAGTSAYNNLSDAREKENVVYGIANALDTVKALKPAKFDFKEGDKNKIGFIAQDVQPLVPEVITSYEKTLPDDTKEERLSIQESSLTAVLVAAMQELAAKVEALEAA